MFDELVRNNFISDRLTLNSREHFVKCSRISQILVSYLSHGSAATRLRCGWQCGVSYVANFLENTTVKEFLKLANIC